MNRRIFVKSATAAAGLLAISPFALHARPRVIKNISDRIMLGKMGIEVSRMAMGTGTHGVNRNSNQTRQLGIKGVADLLKAGYDMGVTFWDSADQYGTHPHLKEALKLVPREKVVILSKTHASTEDEMKADLDRFRKELGTDYIDIMLLHCMMSDDWPKVREGAMKVLSEAREKGVIRAHGVSCHTFGALKSAAASPWVQIDLARINPYGAVMDSKVPAVVDVLTQMNQSGKVIIGMKIFGGGELTNHVDECLKYALDQDYLPCFTIGVESLSQLKDLAVRVPAAS